MTIILAWFFGFGLLFLCGIWFTHLFIEYVKENKGWVAVACLLVAIGTSYGSVQVAHKIVTDVAVSYYKRGQVDGINYCLQVAEEVKKGN